MNLYFFKKIICKYYIDIKKLQIKYFIIEEVLYYDDNKINEIFFLVQPFKDLNYFSLIKIRHYK